MSKKLLIKTYTTSSIVIRRNATKAEKLVYIACANKKINYFYGKSKIVYIGTTQAGAKRIAVSAANKAEDLLKLHGINELEFFTITCNKVQNVKSWRKLERALILTFRDKYGGPPKSNYHGIKMKWKDETKYFTNSKLKKVIDKYS